MIYPRFSFAKEPRATGLARIAEPYPNTQIKLRGKMVGLIYAPGRFKTSQDMWSISLKIPRRSEEITPDDTCPWKWVRLKARFKTEPEAREWILAHNDVLQRTYDPYGD